MSAVLIKQGEMLTIHCDPCQFCGEQMIIPVNAEDAAAFRQWREGEFVQRAFGHWSADQRELLISGTHPDCWEEFMREPDD